MRLRERDIRPPDILAEYLRLNAEDGQRLLEQAGTLERRSCPGCNANNPQPAFKKEIILPLAAFMPLFIAS